MKRVTPEEAASVGLKPPSHKAMLRSLRESVFAAIGYRTSTAEDFLSDCIDRAISDIETISFAMESADSDAERDSIHSSLRALRDRLVLANQLGQGLFDPDHPEQTVLATAGKAGAE